MWTGKGCEGYNSKLPVPPRGISGRFSQLGPRAVVILEVFEARMVEKRLGDRMGAQSNSPRPAVSWGAAAFPKSQLQS